MPLLLPSIIGHRGAKAYAPENTIESIHTAADMGCKWVEFDVKITKDFVPILMHDDTLERTTNGHGNVADLTYAELADLEAGSWFGESFSGIKIPTLEDAIDVVLARDLGINLEIKPCEGRDKETAEAILDIMSQIWDDRDRLLISSFSHVSLEIAADMAGDWYRGLLLDSEPIPNWAEVADYLEATTINIDGNTATREFVEDIMDTGRPILAYTINDPQKAKQLRQWGVDGFFTDMPDIVNESLFRAH